ncbi:uncharacterized protein LOC144301974 isoform X3 [Canis aureus]
MKGAREMRHPEKEARGGRRMGTLFQGLHLSLPRTRSTSFLQHSPTSLALMQPGKDGLLTCLLREKLKVIGFMSLNLEYGERVLQNQQGQDPGVQSI